MSVDVKELATELEGYETPLWAVEAVLDVELMTPLVLDPCVGFFQLSDAATRRGHHVTSIDIHAWEEGRDPIHTQDFLTFYQDLSNTTVFMNAPFSLACHFVDHARMMNARKIICFQRFAWREGSRDSGKKRGAWWEANPPARIWLCGDRATCKRFDLLGEKMGNPPTAHAWFVWERGHRGAEITRALYK